MLRSFTVRCCGLRLQFVIERFLLFLRLLRDTPISTLLYAIYVTDDSEPRALDAAARAKKGVTYQWVLQVCARWRLD